MIELLDIVDAVERLRREHGRVVVGVSGFGGSGKSTLARALVAHISHSARLRGDDFLDPIRSDERSADWDGVERLRMRHEAIEPFARNEPASYRPFDWTTYTLGDSVSLPDAVVLIVDAIGLFHPEMDGCLDLTVWLDVSLEVAQQRGMQRDKTNGHDHDWLWNEVWVPNDRDFAEEYSPTSTADLLYVPDDVRQGDGHHREAMRDG